MLANDGCTNICTVSWLVLFLLGRCPVLIGPIDHPSVPTDGADMVTRASGATLQDAAHHLVITFNMQTRPAGSCQNEKQMKCKNLKDFLFPSLVAKSMHIFKLLISRIIIQILLKHCQIPVASIHHDIHKKV